MTTITITYRYQFSEEGSFIASGTFTANGKTFVLTHASKISFPAARRALLLAVAGNIVNPFLGVLPVDEVINIEAVDFIESNSNVDNFAFANVTVTGGIVTINANVGVGTITRTSTGVFVVTTQVLVALATDFCAIASPNMGAATIATCQNSIVGGVAVTTVRIFGVTALGTPTDSNFTISFMGNRIVTA